MKYIFSALALALAATPAMAADNAAFTGVRAEVSAGFNDIDGVPDTDEVVYGAAVGFDAPVGDKFTIGIEANSQNVFDDERTIGAAARVGYAFSPTVLGYAKAGYSSYEDVFSRDLDGLSVGGGIDVAVTPNAYVKAEYKYSDFENGVGSHNGLVGVGLRF